MERIQNIADSPRGPTNDPVYYDSNQYPGTAAAHFQMTPAINGTKVDQKSWNCKEMAALMFGVHAPKLNWNMHYLLHPMDDEQAFWDMHIAI